MKRIAMSVLLAASLSGCAGYNVYELAGGYDTSRHMPWSHGQSGGFDDTGECNDTLRFTARRESANGRLFASVTHISHLTCGWPVNDKPERWLDVVEVGVRIGPRPGRP